MSVRLGHIRDEANTLGVHQSRRLSYTKNRGSADPYAQPPLQERSNALWRIRCARRHHSTGNDCAEIIHREDWPPTHAMLQCAVQFYAWPLHETLLTSVVGTRHRHMAQAEHCTITRIDKRIKQTHGVIVGNILLKPGWALDRFVAVRTLDVAPSGHTLRHLNQS